MTFFNLCAVALGLTLPGFLFARQLRLADAWAAAFPFSALFLVETVIGFSVIGVPVRFGTMAGALLIFIAGTLVAGTLRRGASEAEPLPDEETRLPRYLPAVVLLVAAAILATVVLRTSYFPLRGLDTTFRWEGLARAMLQQHSLDFYPPVSAGDYSIYVYPDGIPPLVATVYWWIYAALDKPLPQFTSISIGLQLAATMALTFFGARHAFGPRAAWFALLALCALPLLINGFAIGQETGFTALSVAGQFCFAWAAVRDPRRANIFAAAAFAALGALARDYGPAMAVAGFSVLAWHRQTRRHLPTFILTAVLLSAPWYLRSWVLTGNPFYSHRIPGGFAVNPVHAAIMDYYKEIFSFARYDQQRWIGLFKHLFSGAFLGLIAGIPYLASRWREAAPLLATAILVTLLWGVSVAQTAGGVIFSTRVLTPAMVALAIAAGAALARLHDPLPARRKAARLGLTAALLLLCGFSLGSAANYPFPSRYFFTATTSTPLHSIQQVIVDSLDETDLPPTGVLTDLPFVAEVMKRQSRFRPVMYWSPEVDFVLDNSLPTEEIHRRLLMKNIRLVLVDQQSQNNKFLARFNFFRDRSTWSPLLGIPNESAVFFFAQN